MPAPQPRTGRQHVTPVLRLTLVDPKQGVAHRHVEVGRPKIFRPAELAVPGMGEFVGQQVPARRGLVVVGEIVGVGSVFTGTVVFGAHLLQFVAEREQEVVVVIVARAVELVGLLNQGAMGGQNLRLDLQLVRFFRDDVQMNRRRCARIQIDPGEVASGEQRAVHQGLQAGGLEADAGAWAGGAVQGDAITPSIGQGHVGLNWNLPRKIARRIEHRLDELQIHHLGGDADRTDRVAHRREVLKVDLQAGCRVGCIDMEGEDIHRVTRPGDGPAVGVDAQAGQPIDRPLGRVIARYPLRIEQGHLAAGNGDDLVHAHDPPFGVAGVHRKPDHAGIGPVLGRGDRWDRRSWRGIGAAGRRRAA